MATQASIKTKPAARRRRRPYAKSAAGALRLAPVVALDVVTMPRTLSLLIVAACAAMLAYFSINDQFYIYRPVVIGNQYVRADDVIEASELFSLHVAWVQPERAAQMIAQRLPDVRSAQVVCTLPANCTITVEERQPLFVWRQGAAHVWVDASGVPFTAHDPNVEALVLDMPPGPLPLPGQPISATLLAGVQALRQAMPELKSLRYTPERGLEFSDPAGGWPVYLGQEPDIDAQMAVWRALSDNLVKRGVRPTFIDVRYAQAPYYSTR
jgi:cell division septal protein FtsQ